MEISPRNRTRLLALGAAALIIGIGWWLTHRGASTSTSSVQGTAAPADPLSPVGGTNTTTTTTNAGPVLQPGPIIGPGPTGPVNSPTNNGGQNATVYGAPTFTDYTPAAAPQQATFSTAPKAQTANPHAPAGHQQADALQQLGGFFGGIGNAGNWILPGAGYVAGPAIAVGTNEIGWIGQQLPGLAGDINSAAGNAWGGAGQAYNNANHGLNGLLSPILAPIFGGGAQPKKPAPAPAAPLNPFVNRGPIQPATAASQLAHRGLPAPKAPIPAPAKPITIAQRGPVTGVVIQRGRV